MIRFGIQDYEPHWLNGRDSIAAVHGRRLARLAGRALLHVWVVWDLEDDEWFTDAPVLLDFGDERVTIDHQKFDDLCITWDAVDPTRSIEDSYFNLVWRPDATPQLAELAGQTLQRVALLEWAGDRSDMANGSVAIGLDLSPHWLTIFNALDENGFGFGGPDEQYRAHYFDS
ncbi:hypothetical protein Q0Z83_026650 [Actinoplanes sichuanensis]|uniref:Uncharacterized protein n=1 Tax=Actinoplanes sichuanensis TaxID=512349 RepID=A0ABW4ATK9_9ACTN|nr:hypothetical protein [Actinoplanes sichuanensis]BEL04474.1 hypothetical protein Q0Z83_026650 [Actinoplanes sichuanensis]